MYVAFDTTVKVSLIGSITICQAALAGQLYVNRVLDLFASYAKENVKMLPETAHGRVLSLSEKNGEGVVIQDSKDFK